MQDLTTLAARFQRFAEVECGNSPLYHSLASQIAGDEAVLRLAAQATSEPKPNLLLAAVHYLLLTGEPHDLRQFYPTLGGSFDLVDGLYPAFRSFCLANEHRIFEILQTHRVQTNEVARAAVLLPALGIVAARTKGAPLALIEVGTSAGLLLNVDRYAYDYGSGLTCGDPVSPVRLACESRGEAPPPLPAQMPAIALRVGIDLFPIDVRQPEAADWLRALVWADQTGRFDRLNRAIGLAQLHPPALVAGDAFAALPPVLQAVPADAATCLVHCHTLNQFPPEARERFVALLAAASQERDLYQIALEYRPGEPWPNVTLQTFRAGALVHSVQLATYQAHGDWVDWTLQRPD